MTLFSCPAEAADAIAYVEAVGLIVLAFAFALGLLIGWSTGRVLRWRDPTND